MTYINPKPCPVCKKQPFRIPVLGFCLCCGITAHVEDWDKIPRPAAALSHPPVDTEGMMTEKEISAWLAAYPKPDYETTVKLCYQALAALQALSMKAEGWSPIETAPKDGTVILLYIKLRNIWIEVYWDGGLWRETVHRDYGWHSSAGDGWMPLPPFDTEGICGWRGCGAKLNPECFTDEWKFTGLLVVCEKGHHQPISATPLPPLVDTSDWMSAEAIKDSREVLLQGLLALGAEEEGAKADVESLCRMALQARKDHPPQANPEAKP